MDISAIDCGAALVEREREHDGSPLVRLRGLLLDTLVLQRQLVLALTEIDPGATPGDACAALALMGARSLCDRLVEGWVVLRNRGGETAAVAAFRRHLEEADNTAQWLRGRSVGAAAGATPPGVQAGLKNRNERLYDPELIHSLGLSRLRRLGDLNTAAAMTAKEVLFASGLFLIAARQILAAASPRHEPETSAAFDQQQDLAQATAGLDLAPLARTA